MRSNGSNGFSGDVSTIADSFDLEELDRCAIVLDERYDDSWARAVRLDDHVAAFELSIEIFDLEGDVWDGLHDVGVRRVVLVSRPLDVELALAVAAHEDL